MARVIFNESTPRKQTRVIDLNGRAGALAILPRAKRSGILDRRDKVNFRFESLGGRAGYDTFIRPRPFTQGPFQVNAPRPSARPCGLGQDIPGESLEHYIVQQNICGSCVHETA